MGQHQVEPLNGMDKYNRLARGTVLTSDIWGPERMEAEYLGKHRTTTKCGSKAGLESTIRSCRGPGARCGTHSTITPLAVPVPVSDYFPVITTDQLGADGASFDDEIMETRRVREELRRKLAFATHILDAAVRASQPCEHLYKPLCLPHHPPKVMIQGLWTAVLPIAPLLFCYGHLQSLRFVSCAQRTKLHALERTDVPPRGS